MSMPLEPLYWYAYWVESSKYMQAQAWYHVLEFTYPYLDIIENNSVAIVDGVGYRQFERAFNLPIQLNTVELANVVSRKKQVVPQLTEIYKK